jgi:hypothetical protein
MDPSKILGWVILGTAVGLVYLSFLIHNMVTKDRPWVFVAGLFVPMVLTGLYLVLR